MTELFLICHTDSRSEIDRGSPDLESEGGGSVPV
jgi:hypothetical protein